MPINQEYSFRNAFTLAEVLITLGVIGIIAALTIPTLMNKTNNQETITALKEVYSVLSQAYTSVVSENGTPDNWGLLANNSGAGAESMLDPLVPYLKVTKNCESTTSGCLPNVTYTFVDNTPAQKYDTLNTFAKVQLANGVSIATYLVNNICAWNTGSAALGSACGVIDVDINGFKGPNKYGTDFFQFDLTKNGIYPRGTPLDLSSFEATCSGSAAGTRHGEGCAAWVIYNENLDYLKSCGNTLSWTGPTTCN